jgi:hypothetical protein
MWCPLPFPDATPSTQQRLPLPLVNDQDDKVVRHFVGKGNPKYFLRGYVAKHYPSLTVINKKQVQLATQEATALHDILQISGNQLARLDQFF